MLPTSPPSWPRSWPQSAEAGRLWASLRTARRSILLLDYDGTLAPFTNFHLHAYPYSGVADRLTALARSPRIRLALVSGRPARDLEALLGSLGLKTRFEIWGSHGRERLQADGSYHMQPLLAAERAAMDRVVQQMERLGYAQAVEMKPASLAVHWRRIEPPAQERIRSAVKSLSERYAGESGLELHAFDGGMELRSNGCTKGAAVERVLAEEGAGLPAAYLGDDLTDEDAFSALGRRGLSILVRSEPRETLASFWIRPPDELLEFLDGWIQASQTARKRAEATSEAP